MPTHSHALLSDEQIFAEASECIQNGKLAKVLDLCAPLVRRSGAENADAHFLMAYALLALGYAFEARAVVEEGLNVEPRNPKLLTLLGEALIEAGYFADAERSSIQTLELHPANPGALCNLRKAKAAAADVAVRIAEVSRTFLTEDDQNALVGDFAGHYRSVPIVINSRDRCSHLKQLVTWLLRSDYTNILILDNGTTYQPLLDYYNELCGHVTVWRLGKNLGHRAVWRSGLVAALLSEVYFIVSVRGTQVRIRSGRRPSGRG